MNALITENIMLDFQTSYFMQHSTMLVFTTYFHHKVVHHVESQVDYADVEKLWCKETGVDYAPDSTGKKKLHTEAGASG